MKTILMAILLLAPLAAGAQNAGSEKDRAAQKSCDELLGQAKEACLKQGGTVKANSAAGGSTARRDANPPAPAVGSSSERTAEPDAKKDYTKPDSK